MELCAADRSVKRASYVSCPLTYGFSHAGLLQTYPMSHAYRPGHLSNCLGRVANSPITFLPTIGYNPPTSTAKPGQKQLLCGRPGATSRAHPSFTPSCPPLLVAHSACHPAAYPQDAPPIARRRTVFVHILVVCFALRRRLQQKNPKQLTKEGLEQHHHDIR
jgi:hypothetical protein